MFIHPAKVCMTYYEHFKHSMKFSYMFMFASFKACIHAIIPDVYITSTTNTIKEIAEIIENSECKQN